jgi:hypothetical protein
MIGGGENLVAPVAEGVSQYVPKLRMVLDHQDHG